jgi:hypothetical protein
VFSRGSNQPTQSYGDYPQKNPVLLVIGQPIIKLDLCRSLHRCNFGYLRGGNHCNANLIHCVNGPHCTSNRRRLEQLKSVVRILPAATYLHLGAVFNWLVSTSGASTSWRGQQNNKWELRAQINEFCQMCDKSPKYIVV